jgi:acetyl-CoA carboxylase alpha subunit
VEKDLREAYAWSLLAVRQGEAKAKENAETLARTLGMADRFRASRRADALAREFGLP